jgi:hypothetical protein
MISLTCCIYSQCFKNLSGDMSSNLLVVLKLLGCCSRHSFKLPNKWYHQFDLTLSIGCYTSILDGEIGSSIYRMLHIHTRHGNWAGWGRVLPSSFPSPIPTYLHVTLPIPIGDKKLNPIPVPDGFGYPIPIPVPVVIHF